MLSNDAARLTLGNRIVEASLPRVVYQSELLTVLDFILQEPVQGQYLPWRYRRIRLLVLPDSLQVIDRKSLHRWLNSRHQATVIAGKNR